MKLSLSIITLFGALAVSGCDNNTFTRRLLKSKPTAQQASGTYILSAANVDKVEAGLNEKLIAQEPASTLELQPDGTAVIHDFPMLPDAGNFNYSFAGLKTFKATWRILPVGSVSDGGANTADVYGIAIDPIEAKEKTEVLSFTGSSTPDGLVLSLYDGSSDQMLEFSRQAAPAGPRATGS